MSIQTDILNLSAKRFDTFITLLGAVMIFFSGYFLLKYLVDVENLSD